MTGHIPVLMLTARTLEEQRAQGYAHGADAYLTKPFSTPVLLALLIVKDEAGKVKKQKFVQGNR